MQIKKPDWSQIWQSGHNLDNWFNEHVTPINKMLSEGVEVKGNANNHWYTTDKLYEPQHTQLSHSALLINITQIKKETAEDVLRDIINESKLYAHNISGANIKRAKAVLKDPE